jgi:L-alanine-DL-glutamate epimerase-like enolase superfamily enzyme
MRISRITVWEKTLPLMAPYWLSGGRLKVEAPDSTFVRIDTDEGLVGWGEGCPWGHSYLPAFGAGARATRRVWSSCRAQRDWAWRRTRAGSGNPGPSLNERTLRHGRCRTD